jgi:hypothetical protein
LSPYVPLSIFKRLSNNLHLCAAAGKYRIGCQQPHRFGGGLRDEDAIERIFVD